MGEVQTIAVIGAGIMGRGIAHAAALGGYRTILEDLLPGALRKAETEIRANLDQAVELHLPILGDDLRLIDRRRHERLARSEPRSVIGQLGARELLRCRRLQPPRHLRQRRRRLIVQLASIGRAVAARLVGGDA